MRLRFRVDKPSRVTLTLRRRGAVALQVSASLAGGAHWFAVTPRRGGPLDVGLRAVDLAGNASEASAELDVLPARSAGAGRVRRPWRRARSSTRARAGSARPRSPLPPRAGAPPRAAGRSSCPPTRRTRSPTPSRPSWAGPRPRRGPALGAAGLGPGGARAPVVGRARLAGGRPRRARRRPHLGRGADGAARHGRAVQPAPAQAPPRRGRLRRRRGRLRAHGRDAAAPLVPRRRPLVAREGLPPAQPAHVGARGRWPARCSTSRSPARRCSTTSTASCATSSR